MTTNSEPVHIPLGFEERRILSNLISEALTDLPDKVNVAALLGLLTKIQPSEEEAKYSNETLKTAKRCKTCDGFIWFGKIQNKWKAIDPVPLTKSENELYRGISFQVVGRQIIYASYSHRKQNPNSSYYIQHLMVCGANKNCQAGLNSRFQANQLYLEKKLNRLAQDLLGSLNKDRNS